MRLHTRILLGYGYLVGLLVLSAVGATAGFQDLGSEIGTVLEENFESVRSSMRMLEALERQDSAVLALLLEEEEQSRHDLEESEEAFTAAIRRARDNITIEAEVEVLDDIDARFQRYRVARDALLASRRERPLREYEERTFPAFEAVKQRVFDLLDVNHRAMVAADREAQRAATARAGMHGLLVAIALVSLAPLSSFMNRNVLRRLDELGAVAGAIAAGERDRRVTVTSHDELGMVGIQLNAVLDHQRAMEAEMRGQLGRHRQLLIGLLDAFPGGGAVVSRSGRVVASRLADHDTNRLRALAPELADRDPDEDRSVILEDADGAFRLELLESDGRRPVGWLASPQDDRAGGE